MIREAMRYIDQFHELRVIVQVREMSLPAWETIAAFNSHGAAESYAVRCAETHSKRYEYRVQRWRDGDWVQSFLIKGTEDKSKRIS